MGLVKVDAIGSRGMLLLTTDSGGLWFWFAITAPLMVITMAAWIIWEKRTSRSSIDDMV